MKLPFVTRGRFEDEQARAGELRAEITALKAELDGVRKDLTRVSNYWTWRTAGAPIYPELIPQEYRIQPAAPDATKNGLDEEITSEIDEVIQRVGSTQARKVTKGIQFMRNEEAVKAGISLPQKKTGLTTAASAFEQDLSSTEKSA